MSNHIWNLVISHIIINVTLSIFKSSSKHFSFSEEFNLHTFPERATHHKFDSILEMFTSCTVMNNLEMDFSG